MLRWLSGDALTQSVLQAGGAGDGLSLYDLGGPFMMLAAVVSALLIVSVVRHCVRRRRASNNRLPVAKLVIPLDCSVIFHNTISANHSSSSS